MEISFVPWAGLSDPDQAVAIAECLTGAVDDLEARDVLTQLWGSSGTAEEAGPRIRCHVVDVTPTSDEFRVDALIDALHAFACGEILTASDGFVDRLIFVGATPSVDAWEDESEAGAKTIVRSRKKAAELYIRVCQAADIAHYGTLFEHPSAFRSESGALQPLRSLGRSAVLNLARHYVSQGRLETLQKLQTRLVGDLECAFDLFRGLETQIPLPDDKTLLRETAVAFQLGKRRPSLVPGSWNFEGGGEGVAQRGAYVLKAAMDAELQTPSGDPETMRGLVQELSRYELLRDAGRNIAVAATRRLALRQGALLIIDDALWASRSERSTIDQTFLSRLTKILGAVGWAETTWVASSGAIPAIPGDRQVREPVDIPTIDVRPLLADPDGPVTKKSLDRFDLYLMEVDSRVSYVGPSAVQSLHAVLQASLARRDRGTSPETDFAPPIMVFTRTESFGHIQQSLNLGASAYVLKERIHQLPFQMLRSLEASDASRMKTPTASSYKMLEALRPETRAKLHKEEGTSFLHGSAAVGGVVLMDEREQRWLRELPKADLHCHLGTCISFAALRLMAENTAAYALAAPGESLSRESSRVSAVAQRIAKTVALADWIHAANKSSPRGDRLAPMMCLWIAAGAVARKAAAPPPDFGVGDKLISMLVGADEGIAEFEAVAILVSLLRPSDIDKRDTDEVTGYFAAIARELTDDAGSEAVRRTWKTVQRRLKRAVDHWDGVNTEQSIVKLAPGDLGDLILHLSDADLQLGPDSPTRLASLRKKLRDALEAAREALGTPTAERDALLGRVQALARSMNVLDRLPGALYHHDVKDDDKLTLTDLVQLPKDGSVQGDSSATGLRRYLWGADFLGASHLQYPENLLLAAFALTRDNAMDNVTYCEVRCETTGFRRAGMPPAEATRLLCAGFDLAAAFLNSPLRPVPLPLVRTNILLAAKRHKGAGAAREVIGLMQWFLHRREDNEDVESQMPQWWKPCAVVGFDISGDESKDAEWLEKAIEPLADRSASITIHAGEAASADSIWRAVYKYNATRIGHGLRLRENATLLRYCVREGICMEMCPNSNVFTNAYHPYDDGTHATSLTNPRRAYPLLEYMRAGLEVAISTDNRYIHREGERTLTSEYMTAARLSNGLTRWEVLQLAKAGFKNAFLEKDDILRLVSEMERRTYRIISRGWF